MTAIRDLLDDQTAARLAIAAGWHETSAAKRKAVRTAVTARNAKTRARRATRKRAAARQAGSQ